MKVINKIRVLAVVGGVFLLVTAALAPATAQDSAELERLFTSYNNQVDVAAANATIARSRAIKLAERAAYDVLMGRLVPADKIELIPPLDANSLTSYVRGFEVHDEATSTGRYMARIDISFMPQAIMDHWTAAGVTFALNAGPALCFAHGHFEGHKALLWEPENPAFAAWDKLDWKNTLRDYRPATGTVRTRAALDVALMWQDPIAAANQLAAGCDMQAAVVVATKLQEAQRDAPKKLLYRYYVSDVGLSGAGIQEMEEADTLGDSLTHILGDILYRVDEAWRLLSTVEGDDAGDISLMLPVDTARDIAKARLALARLSVVRDIKTVMVGLPLSRLQVSYTGSYEQFILAVQQAGYVVTRWGEDFMLRPIAE